MSLNVSYVIEIVEKTKDLDINWWEEVLHPDDVEGFALLKRAHPTMKFTTGEHEYTKYGFRRLLEGRNVDIIQPDIMWCGGLTELLKISAQAAAYDVSTVCHASKSSSFLRLDYSTNIEQVVHTPTTSWSHKTTPLSRNTWPTHLMESLCCQYLATCSWTNPCRQTAR